MWRKKVLVLMIPFTLSLRYGYSQVLTPEASPGPQSTNCIPTTLELTHPYLVSGMGKPPLYYVIRNKADWDLLTHKAFNPPEFATPVDLQKQMLVVFTYMAQTGHLIDELKIDRACVLPDGFRIEYTLKCFGEIQKGPIHYVSGVRRWEAVAVVLPQSSLPVTVTGKVLKNSPAPIPAISSSAP